MSTPTPGQGHAEEPQQPSNGGLPSDGQHGTPASDQPQPGYGQYGTPSTDQPQPGYGQYGGASGGWGDAPAAPSYGTTPPAGGPPGDPGAYGQYGAAGPAPSFGVSQPGIIPLRPLTLGEIYDGAFKAIRANAAVMFGLTAVVVLVVSVLQGIATWGLFEQYQVILGDPNAGTADLEDLYATLTSTVVPLMASQAVSFVITTILNGVLIHSVSQSVIGRRLGLGELWALVRPQLLRLLLLTLLVGLLVVVAMVLAAVPLILGALTGDIGATLGLGLLSLLLMLGAWLFATVATLLATPALVLERATPVTALRRSWELTRAMFWRIAGIYLLTVVLVGIVAQIVVTPVTMVAQLVGGVSTVTVASLIGATLATAVTTPFVASVVALLYIDVRIRREGLDVELAAAGESA